MKNNKTSQKLIVIATLFILATSCASKKELAYSEPVYLSEKGSTEELDNRIRSLSAELQTTRNWNADLRNLNSELTRRLEAARASLHQVSKQAAECPDAMNTGIVFKVQIGAFKVREITDDLTTPNMLVTEKENEIQKVIVGQFRDYYKAELLKAHIQAMGIEDAWVVSYKDGYRITIKLALQELASKP